MERETSNGSVFLATIPSKSSITYLFLLLLNNHGATMHFLPGKYLNGSIFPRTGKMAKMWHFCKKKNLKLYYNQTV